MFNIRSLFLFAIFRALGDFEYKNVDGKGPKEQLVSPEPEFYMKLREPEIDEFLVLACDGVWDVMTNEELVNFVSARMRVTDDLEAIANEVIDTCLHKVIIILLVYSPKFIPIQICCFFSFSLLICGIKYILLENYREAATT